MKALSLSALAFVLLLGNGCGQEEKHRLPPHLAGPPPRIDPATLLEIPVHPESLQGVDESRIYHQLGAARGLGSSCARRSNIPPIPVNEEKRES